MIMADSNCTLEIEGAGTPECVFRLAGVLDFSTVPEIHRRALEAFPSCDQATVDFAGVTHSNSAGLALLVEWQHLSATAGRTLLVRNAPENLLNLARVCELVPMLPREIR